MVLSCSPFTVSAQMYRQYIRLVECLSCLYGAGKSPTSVQTDEDSQQPCIICISAESLKSEEFKNVSHEECSLYQSNVHMFLVVTVREIVELSETFKDVNGQGKAVRLVYINSTASASNREADQLTPEVVGVEIESAVKDKDTIVGKILAACVNKNISNSVNSKYVGNVRVFVCVPSQNGIVLMLFLLCFIWKGARAC